MSAPTREPIAIIGMSGRFPGAASLEAFWENVRAGVDCLTTFSDAELEAAGIDATLRSQANWVARGTVLEDAELFDASAFGYSPREAQIIDPQQRVFLECAWEALDHAGYGGDLSRKSVGVYAGSSMNTYFLSQLLPNRALTSSVGGYQLMIGNDKDFLCTRVSYKLNLQGPSMTIQTACSTSLVAIQVACRALQRGECDLALAGGVSICFPQRTGYQFQEGMIFSPDGVCRPFDAEARGTRAGAGAGVIVLKRLSAAIADRDTICAVILGAAVNNDGSDKVGYTAPSVDGQMAAIVTAQALASVDARSISYVEAHGTATPLGDPIEMAALSKAFRASTADRAFCALGSLKANLGHLDAAAGVAGLIKTVLALSHRELPPLAHFRSPNPQLALDSSPFRVPQTLEPWPSTDTPRRAGVSSFGIGGTNAHVVLEEAPAPQSGHTHRAQQLLVLSARTPEALTAATVNLSEHLRANPTLAIADVANTLQLGRRLFPQRRCVVVRDAAEAVSALAAPERPPVLNGVHEGGARPVAFLFSGQGSQHAGMAWQLYESEPVFRSALDRCAELLRPLLDCDVRQILREGSDAVMGETRLTQPLLFATEYALATLWMTWGVEPAAMLGHSIGEYVAAHLAGVFSLEDALTLVAARGRLMQALPPGAMLAVSLPAEDLQTRLRAGLEIAALNAPSLCSVSGTTEAIEALGLELTDAGIEHRALHTSHAFHSAMMQPALAPFREIVERLALTAPSRRYVSNLTGTWIRPEQATSPEYYVSHLRSAVRFAEGVATLAADPSLLLLEVGPGTALSSLARLTLGRDKSSRVISSLPHAREQRPQAESLLTAAARLWTAGVTLNWEGMHRDEQLRRVRLPAYPFERKRHWVDAPERVVDAPAESYRRQDLKDWFHVPTWARADLPANRRLALDGSWLVFGGGDALTSEIAAQLRAKEGASVIIVRSGEAFSSDGHEDFTLRPQSDADYQAIFDSLRSRPLRGVIHLWNVGPRDAIESAVLPLHSLMTLGRALLVAQPSSMVRVVVATSGAQSVLGEAITAPARALVTGPALVLPVEHEGVHFTAIDVDDSAKEASTVARSLLEEAAADDSEPFVARRAGLRWARRYSEATLPVAEQPDLPLKQHGIYLITGGMGGIGLTLATWLATRVSARVVLSGRKSLPAREHWEAWLSQHAANDPTTEIINGVRRVEAAGGEVLLVKAEVSDEKAMLRVVEETRTRFGAIDGVIHSAGVAGGSAIAFAEAADTDAVLSAKVAGTRVLARVFGTTPLDFFVVFSSISAVIGAAGGCAYAAACAYLDAFVLSADKPTPWRQALSIAWDAWRDVGMAERVVVPAAMRAARKAYVAAGISPEGGADAFGRALATGLPRIVVSPFEVERVLNLGRQAPPSGDAATHSNPDPAGTAPPPAQVRRDGAFDAPEGDLERALATMWEDLLGVQPIGASDNFFQLGGHSLLATRILARIDETFGVRLPLRVVFDAPTVRQLAQQLAASTSNEAAPEATGEREEFEL